MNAGLEEEQALYRRGVTLVAGVDEAGRGALAGPIVAAAVILPKEMPVEGIRDSKTIPPARRERMFGVVTGSAVAWAVGIVDPADIDARGIQWANREAFLRALSGLTPAPQHILTDWLRVTWNLVPVTPVTDGDATVRCIAAASIVAKVTRDRLLVELDGRYPGYGLAQHKGYGSAAHLAMLRRLGPSPVHRRTFAPLKVVY